MNPSVHTFCLAAAARRVPSGLVKSVCRSGPFGVDRFTGDRFAGNLCRPDVLAIASSDSMYSSRAVFGITLARCPRALSLSCRVLGRLGRGSGNIGHNFQVLNRHKQNHRLIFALGLQLGRLFFSPSGVGKVLATKAWK